MKLIRYELSGVIELFKKLYEIDDLYASKGKSNQRNITSDGRVQLGANMDSVLNMTSANFVFDNLTFFDIETMSKLATTVDILSYPIITFNPVEVTDDGLKSAIPDLYNYIHESNSIILDIIREGKYDTARKLSLLGGIKMKASISFRGKDILMLFNGFLENYLYSTFKSSKDLDDDNAISIIKRDTLVTLMETFMKTSYQSSQKPSLIEDFMIQKDFYAYIKNADSDYGFSLASISYPGGDIRFYGASSAIGVHLTNFKKFTEDSNDIVSKSNTVMTFGVTSSILTYMVLKTFGRGFKIIANQKYDILFSESDYNFNIDPDLRNDYTVRINSMLNHHLECKNIVLNDVKTETNLSHPASRYGMIFSGQKIKYLIQFSLSQLMGIGIRLPYDDNSTIINLFDDPVTLIDAIRDLTRGIDKKYLGLLEKRNK